MRPARAATSSAWRRPSTPVPTPSSPARLPQGRSCCTPICGATGPVCRRPATWASTTAAGTGGCLWSGSRGSRRPSSGPAPTTRSTSSSAIWCEWGAILLKFWVDVSPEEQLRRFQRTPERPGETVEDHRRGLAQPRQVFPVQGSRGGHVPPDVHARSLPGRCWKATTSATPASRPWKSSLRRLRRACTKPELAVLWAEQI